MFFWELTFNFFFLLYTERSIKPLEGQVTQDTKARTLKVLVMKFVNFCALNIISNKKLIVTLLGDANPPTLKYLHI